MASMSRLMLSASADGDPITIATLAPIDGSDTLLHTGITGTTDIDHVTLFAYNDDTVAVTLHVKYGDGSISVKQAIPPQAGWVLIAADAPINDGNTIEAAATTINKIIVQGYVTRVDN